MFFLRFLIPWLLLCGSQAGYAKINFQVDSHIDLLLINGKKPNVDYYPLSGIHTLENGENQIVFRYIHSFDKGGYLELVESDIIIAKFKAEFTQLKIESKSYSSAEKARKEISQLQWSLIDVPTNESIPYISDKLETKGFALGRDYEMALYEYNLTNAPAAVNQLAKDDIITSLAQSVPATTPASSAAPSPTTGAHDAALLLLYEQADDNTKQKIKQYMTEQ